MSIEVKVPAEYLDIRKQMWAALRKTENNKSFYDSTFAKRVYDSVISEEAWIRDQFISQGNYIIDPYNNTGLRYTGMYIFQVVLSMMYLANTSIDANMNSRCKQFLLDLEEYLRREAVNDGNCLTLLGFVATAICPDKNDTTIGWGKYQSIVNFSNTLDVSKLDWMAINGYTALPADLDAIKQSSVFYYSAGLSFQSLFFNELYLEENINKLVNNINIWTEKILTGMTASPVIDIYYVPFIGQVLPISFSYMERALSVIWFSKTLTDLQKVELIFKIYKAYELISNLITSMFKQNISPAYDTKNSTEVVNSAEDWAVEVIMKQLCISNNAPSINTLIAKFKELNVFPRVKDSIVSLLSKTESIVTMLGDNFIPFYNNVLKLECDEMKCIIADSLEKCSLPRLSNEIIATVKDETLKKVYTTYDTGAIYVLTTTIPGNAAATINIVNDVKAGTDKISVQYCSGKTDKFEVSFIDHFAALSIDVKDPIILTIGHDTVFITIE